MFRTILQLLCVFMVTETVCGHRTCIEFDVKKISRNDSKVSVNFTVNNACLQEIQYLKLESLSSEAGPQPLCYFIFENGNPVTENTESCLYDPESQIYSFTATDEDTVHETWRLSGELLNDESFSKEIDLLKYLTDTTVVQIMSTADQTESTVETASTPTTVTEGPSIIEKSSVFFSVASVIVVLIAVVLNALWRLGKCIASRRSRLPPAPAPHRVRRAAGEGVMFRFQPSPLPDRHSFVSVQVHDYAEIPDDIDTSSSNKSLTTLNSSSVSDSSMSDCLHHIACPSSDSSLPEDYLHPVDSDYTDDAAFKEEDSHSSSSSEAVMYAQERITFKKKSTKRS